MDLYAHPVVGTFDDAEVKGFRQAYEIASEMLGLQHVLDDRVGRKLAECVLREAIAVRHDMCGPGEIAERAIARLLKVAAPNTKH